MATKANLEQGISRNPLMDTEDEKRTWLYYLKLGGPPSWIFKFLMASLVVSQAWLAYLVLQV